MNQDTLDDYFQERKKPINNIQNKPFHQILISDINPYHGRELVKTIYLMGSPGSGKSRLLLRLRDETEGKLVIESGVFDLFQKYVREYVQRKRDEGVTESIGFSDLDFDMPHIDGLDVHYNHSDGLEDETTTVKNAPYWGMGAYHYREFLSDISSGGKSGYPDWLLIPTSDSQYVQFISFPGHRNISTTLENKSIPKIPAPDTIIYLVDPDIQTYHHEEWAIGHKNPALIACKIHYSDVLEFKNKGIIIHWRLSKTNPKQLDENRKRAIEIYSQKNLDEIVRRLPDMKSFDSFDSTRQELFENVGQIIGLQ